MTENRDHLGWITNVTSVDMDRLRKEDREEAQHRRNLGLKHTHRYFPLEHCIADLEDLNYQRGYFHGGVPLEAVDPFDLPYPPPDKYRVYQPTGPLGEALEARLRKGLSDWETLDTWMLLEKEEEVGYSEYTMESEYSYQVMYVTNGEHYHELDFDAISDILNWITS